MFNSSQKYSTKFESNKQTDSKILTPKGHKNMKRKVKITSITGVGISGDGLTQKCLPHNCLLLLVGNLGVGISEIHRCAPQTVTRWSLSGP